MTCEHRKFLRMGWAAIAVLAAVLAWGAPSPENEAQTQPRAGTPSTPNAAGSALGSGATPLVKPSETPHLLFLFTDQVVGYIQPCG